MTRPSQTPLASARKAAHMSQTDLAVRSGISRNQVSRIENGVHRPKLTTRVLLAHALSCDPRKLFPDLDDPQTPTDQE